MTANIKARRKLADLYKRGVSVRFGPDGPKIGPFEDNCPANSVEIYVAVPSPLQREQAIRDARAESLNIKIRAKKDSDTVEGAVVRETVTSLNDQELIEFILSITQGERDREAERDVLSREEWQDITALQDQMRRYDEGELEKSGEDYEALMAKDKQYGEDVHNRRVELTDASREALALLPREELERRAIDQQLELIASEAFVTEYTRQMLYYAAREANDNDVLFFDSPSEIGHQNEQVQQTLEDALGQFLQDEAEVKNVSGAEDGSVASTPPSEEGTSEASIPKE